jgi:type VI secretion system secreted protein VgrG
MSVICDDKQVFVCKTKATINAGDQLTIKVGSAKIKLTKNGDITIEGKKITIKGSGDVKMKGSKIALN